MICHAIERTSPKGGPFLGTCMRCGRTDLPGSAVAEPCENIAGMTDDEALLVAIEPPLNSVAIQRIIDEIRAEKDAPLTGYNRVYHRHNR